jgi:hypothetical protein
MSSGKWYCEYVWTSGATNSHVGVATGNINLNTYLGNNATAYTYFANGEKWNNNSGTAYGASYANGDVIGVAFDADNGTLTFYKNNVSQGTAFTGLTSGPYFFGIGMGESGQAATMNFGQRPFAYTPPTGFKALNTQNLPASTVVDGGEYFNTVLYTGNGSTNNITGVGFQPDLVWIKDRTGTAGHALHDAVRTSPFRLASSSTNAESDESASFTGFASDGFSLAGNDTTYNNNTPRSYVAWNWKANGAGVSNTDGTITSTVSVNTTSGFSIVTYTGTGSNATVGHGLGVAPAMVIAKTRSLAGENWRVWQQNLTSGTHYLNLNTTGAQASNSTFFTAVPTSTVINVGTDDSTNRNGTTYVAYCFAPVAGYSAFGSYTGNGSADGPFVYLGFRPRWLMVKDSSAGAGQWVIWDTARDTYNIVGNELFANSSAAESTSNADLDILSNGVKLRRSATNFNASGVTYIYAAFAENPFKNALAR